MVSLTMAVFNSSVEDDMRLASGDFTTTTQNGETERLESYGKMFAYHVEINNFALT